MAIETKIIQIDRQQSVQKLPEVKGNRLNNAAPILMGTTMRGPLLPAHGTRERELALLQLYRHDYNSLFKSAVAGLTKRVQSIPWELQGEDEDTDLFQHVLLNADFGRGWENFLAKTIIAYSRYDGGAYIELIGAGDTVRAITGPVTGIAILDSLRSMPTGDPEFPVIYMDVLGGLHVMHHTRVVRFFDMPDEDEMSYGYGECALSRCAGAVTRDILMNRYIERSLDDNPPPGIIVFKNLAERQVDEALATLHEERSTDFGGEWGRVIRLYGLHAETTPEIVQYSFSQPPEKFDFDAYKTLNVKEIALGIGLDIQDMWELTGGNIGSATQSEILHQKSKGKALGRILKGLERVLNQALPKALEFRFQYTDPEEDQEQANIAQTWASIATTLSAQLTADEQRRLLSNQVEAIHDVITDPDGNVIRLHDADVVTPEQAQGADPAVIPDIQVEDDENIGKSIETTQASFSSAFVEIVNAGLDGVVSKAAVRMALRAQLQQHGQRAYLDGLEDGGVIEPMLDDEDTQAIAAWRAQQNDYITTFVENVYEQQWTPDQVEQRATMWVNKSLNTLYFDALAKADNQARYMWTVNIAKEHCKSCLRLNGQIHRMKEYTRRGLLPQSKALQCGGWLCGCSLVKTNEPSRGTLRAVPYIRGVKAHHHGSFEYAM